MRHLTIQQLKNRVEKETIGDLTANHLLTINLYRMKDEIRKLIKDWFHSKVGINLMADPSLNSLVDEIQALRTHDAVGRSEQLPPNKITDKEHKDLMKALYLEDKSKRFRR